MNPLLDQLIFFLRKKKSYSRKFRPPIAALRGMARSVHVSHALIPEGRKSYVFRDASGASHFIVVFLQVDWEVIMAFQCLTHSPPSSAERQSPPRPCSAATTRATHLAEVGAKPSRVPRMPR